MSKVEFTPEIQYELTVCEIERERDLWLDARFRRDRGGGFDARANQTFEQHNSRMDYLLEELFGHMAVVGVESGNRPE